MTNPAPLGLVVGAGPAGLMAAAEMARAEQLVAHERAVTRRLARAEQA